MNTALIEQSTAHLPANLEEAAALAKGFIEASLSPATRRAYGSDWRIFSAWCAASGVEALPASPEVVAMFLSKQAEAGVNPSTLTRRVAAIRYAHEAKGYATPTTAKGVAATLKGIRNNFGKPPQKKSAATAEKITEMVSRCPESLLGLRDRALLLLGFAGAFRRSELVGLTVADIEAVPEGLRVTIRQSKTDQEGQGQTIAIYNGERLRPVEAVKAWLEAAKITEGPVFRRVRRGGNVGTEALSADTVAEIVKAYASAVGFKAEDFAGHSLRSGFLTSAAERGAILSKMMEVSRHKRVDTVLGYVRSAELFKNHAGSGFL